MSESWSGTYHAVALGVAGLLLLFDLALSVALIAVDTLTHVALRRLSSETRGRLAFAEHMQEISSPHRIAAMITRQLCLLGAALLVALSAAGAGIPFPAVIALASIAIVGVVLIESALAGVIALWNPRGAVRATAPLVRVSERLLFFVASPMHRLFLHASASHRMSDEEREEEQEEEVEALIELGEREGLLEATEGEMLRGIVDLDETPIREIMTPRTDIVAIPADATISQARRTVLSAGHSRLPVFRDSIDNIVGVLHSRDLFRAWEEKIEDSSVARYLRTATFVPESLSAAELLADMRQKTHLSLVLDEYGGVAGLVTLEDLLEEIVGDIRDEHDEAEVTVRQEKDGSYVVNATTHIKELESLFGVEFEEREFDTVGGMVVFGFGRVPSAGEFIEIRQLRVEVLLADRRRVHRVRITGPAGPASPAQAG